ncbi:hypothetical protein BIY24_06170 [Halobacteriovorax marinus]|uniref:hypothetical protein n=1 Tax=Halobacteriovorax marinus TaxID=97084 RepID=UPI000BC32385|nr:hypothetical protein [Halobacteriovorax marinus]ATH07543.1 hypothetical protein BIY24_06170 [Halobacteriovorax marinus]
MKIIFYTTDKSVKNFYSSLEVENACLCTSLEEVEEQFSSSAHSVVLLDFDCEELNCKALAKEFNVIENVNSVLLSGKMGIKEIMDFQNSSDACDAYLTKPLSVEILTGVINDFEIALKSANDDGSSNSEESENVDLTFIGINKDLLDQLNSADSEDKTGEVEVGADLSDEVDEDDEEEAVDFNASPIQVAKEVRDVIDSHRTSGKGFQGPVHDEIQRKFDAVFGSEREETKEEDEFNITPQGFDEDSKLQDDENGISFDLDSNESTDNDATLDINNDVAQEAVASAQEVKMSNEDENNEGLEFNIPSDEDESTESEQAVVEDASDLDFSNDEDEGGLEFNLGADDDGTQTEEFSNQDTSSDSDLDFSEDTGAGLDLSGESDELESNAEETQDAGMSFDDDTDDGLSLSAEDDVIDNQDAQEDDADPGLSFDDDENDELNLNESYEASEEDAVDADNDALDFSASEAEEESSDSATVSEELNFSADADSDSTDPSFDVGMGTNTSNDIESTISSIVAPDTSSANEDSTGEFDFSAAAQESEEEEEMQEFDYKTSSGFSPSELSASEIEDDDEDEFGSIDESIGEDTNPTVIANTSTLTTSDFSADSSDDSDDDELLFGEETGTNELDSPSFDNTAETVVSTLSENDFTETVATSPSPDPAPTPTQSYSAPNEDFVRNYDEDEMLRLQGTIRQLREEREALMESINQLTSEKQILSQDNLGLKAELDELKIEIEIVKKRSHDEVSEMKYQMNMSQEKKDVFEMKYKTLHKEFERLNQKVRIDFNQVKQREKELESKLELAVMDSDSQVQSRDMKILELKRKIDSLEFNMENSSIREQKHREDKLKLEERLAKIMKTLRGSIQLIEDDLEVLESDNSTELDKN